eukprot:CAMPEP_0195526442 /NCGR_PEP_ID=MMETSP0794_2-20130614/27504_1 /TAXON_ID=515487 /ORGANISM="Stephanopyxis turris, Strain CCMP 815" /LENGTH=307 /DNA_ID=CAMNT_0040657127 /DNA_START=515 /DNA_END=1439 /DNA_ORIENTATION=+
MWQGAEAGQRRTFTATPPPTLELEAPPALSRATRGRSSAPRQVSHPGRSSTPTPPAMQLPSPPVLSRVTNERIGSSSPVFPFSSCGPQLNEPQQSDVSCFVEQSTQFSSTLDNVTHHDDNYITNDDDYEEELHLVVAGAKLGSNVVELRDDKYFTDDDDEYDCIIGLLNVSNVNCSSLSIFRPVSDSLTESLCQSTLTTEGQEKNNSVVKNSDTPMDQYPMIELAHHINASFSSLSLAQTDEEGDNCNSQDDVAGIGKVPVSVLHWEDQLASDTNALNALHDRNEEVLQCGSFQASSSAFTSVERTL